MPKELDYRPPEFHFDDRLASQLARPIQSPPAEPLELERVAAARCSPFADYARVLTPEGGILILYRDCASGWLYTLLRTAVWIILTVTELWLLSKSSMSAGSASIAFLILGSATLFLVTRKIKIRHSVEIRHDRMILDGKHVFWAEDIGPNLPQLEIKDQNNPNRMVIAGVCGTRFVEYMTANRLDDNDRTPEVLAADLQDAIQQLWARDELIFG
jgi:hypothetical protein